ncbi:transcriptional regulator, AraC family [Anaerovirgula multivorans]|uniref:Transcriptional regulator, AraC family n=1 Tax=Anaerovirgula multivorans TaxID=312168 RepID=A0A239JZ59_9FIRM|nr:AraC family transcriptional regulator [Anaerovirgula multivorans]SNT11307.1 transcriptional regulator, AraC family [Anaerovirgula multivorans]
MNGNNKSPYVEQINKVQDYIENHLDESLTVKHLSQIASFSEYHFQRIYGFMTGESLYGFIKRIRLEKAAHMLLSDKERPIIDIAMSVGFSNQNSFAKAFKSKYGVCSSSYRKTNGTVSKTDFVNVYLDNQNMIIAPLKIEIRREQGIKLIYTRYTGPYKGDSELFSNLFHKLYQWVDQRSLISASSRWFVIYHDFGKETDEDQLRLSVCMSVDRNVAASEDIGIINLHEGQYAVGSFMVEPSEYSKAWYYMYGKWLPTSGHKPDDRFSLEHYPKVEEQGGKRLVEIYIPIV